MIRFKLGQMIADVESVHSMLEDMTFQMVTMTEGEINANLAGPIALLKYKQTRVATGVSDHACQIFGGRVSMTHTVAQFFPYLSQYAADRSSRRTFAPQSRTWSHIICISAIWCCVQWCRRSHVLAWDHSSRSSNALSKCRQFSVARRRSCAISRCVRQ